VILKGNQRAGGLQLARHLLNDRDNDHVTVQELRGFVSDDLQDAFNEAYAISRGTKCKQFLFSLSLNPPETESVSVDVFERAIAEIEDKLGLSNQPRYPRSPRKLPRRPGRGNQSRNRADSLNDPDKTV
jgi:hypothetical protein